MMKNKEVQYISNMYVGASSAAKQSKLVKAIPLTAHSSAFFTHWVPSLVPKERFEATAPEHFSCSLCGDPALPFTVLTPCGHVTCQTCAEDSTRCPNCEKPILSRTVVAQLEGCVLASLQFECKTRRCMFVSSDPHEAFRHRCDEAGAQPSQPFDNANALSGGNYRSASGQSNGRQQECLQPVQRSSSGISASGGNANAPQHLDFRQPPAVVQHVSDGGLRGNGSLLGGSFLTTSSRKATTKQRKTLLFWDFESMQPSFYGLQPHPFYRKLLGCLVASFGIASDVQVVVYAPDDLDNSLSQGLISLGAFVRSYSTAVFAGQSERQTLDSNATALFCVDLRQLITNSLVDNSVSFTMFDVVMVTASLGMVQACRSMLANVGGMGTAGGASPFFLHVVSDLTALVPDAKMEMQVGAVSYVDVSDFTRDVAAQ